MKRDAILVYGANADRAGFLAFTFAAVVPQSPVSRVASVEELRAALAEGRSAERLPGLILIDLVRPTAEVIEQIRWIRTRPECRCVPVVVLLGDRDTEELAPFYQAGANSCLVAPESRAELESLLRSIAVYWIQHNITGNDHPPRSLQL